MPELVVRPTQWRIAARFEDGSVAMATSMASRAGHGTEATGSGRLVLANLPLDPSQTNLPQQPVFVPLLHRLVGFVARSAAPDFGRALVGQLLGGTVSPADRAGAETRPAGLAVPPEAPGFYRVASSGADGQREALVAANLDPAEGDLRRTTAARVRACLGDRATVIRPGPDGRVVLPPRTGAGLRLSGPLLAAALLLVLIEFALAQGLRLPSLRV